MVTTSRRRAPVVLTDDVAPGVAFRGRGAGNQTCSVCPSGGEVRRVSP